MTAITLDEKLDLSSDIKLLRDKTPLKGVSGGLSELEGSFNSIINIIKNQLQFEKFEHKEKLRIAKEISAERGYQQIPTSTGELTVDLNPIADIFKTITDKLNSIIPQINDTADVDTPSLSPGGILGTIAGIGAAVTGVVAGVPYVRDILGVTPAEANTSEVNKTGDVTNQSVSPKAPTKPTAISRARSAAAQAVAASPIGAVASVAAAVGTRVHDAISPGLQQDSVRNPGAGPAPTGDKATYMKAAYDAYRREGMTDEGAKTMVAQLNRENHFNPKYLFGTHIDPKNKEVNAGMMSWQGSRGKALLAFMKQKGLLDRNGKIIPGVASIAAMAQFSAQELKTDKRYKRSWDALRDPSKRYSDIEGTVGRNYVGWRRDDPRFRDAGLRNQNQGYREISGLLQEQPQTRRSSGSVLTDMIGLGLETNQRMATAANSQMIIPASGRLTSLEGMRRHPISGEMKLHGGIDIAAPAGSPVVAAKDGVVSFAGNAGRAGNKIIITHGGGLITEYMHLSRINVRRNQSVTAGQQIGAVGSTGGSTGNHLHFGVKRNGKVLNPMDFLPTNARKGQRISSASDVGASISAQSSTNRSAKRQASVAVIVVPSPQQTKPPVLVAATGGSSGSKIISSADKYRAHFG